MKYLSIIVLGLFLSLSANGQDSKDNYTIKVDGLGCPFCAYGLEKKFKEFDGIDDVNINMENGMFTFTYPSDEPLTVERVESQVEAAGYTPVHTKIQRANGDLEESKMAAKIDSGTELMAATLSVKGNCGMCQARIEKTASSVDGVTEASWDKKSKILSFKYDPKRTDRKALAKAIAKKGHDNELDRTSVDTYDALPGCCQYDRDEN